MPNYESVRLVDGNGQHVDLPLGGTEVYTALDNASVPQSGSTNGVSLFTPKVRRVRPFIMSSGADITVTLQSSADGGTTFHNLVSYAVGATGAQAITELPGPFIRLRAANASAIAAQNVDARIVAEKF